MKLFQCSFVSLCRIKIQPVFSEVAITVRTHRSWLPRLTLQFIGTWFREWQNLAHVWQTISFILPPNEYDCVYAWTTLRQVGLPILAKTNHLFRWSSFWPRRVCKQAKLSHLGHKKSVHIHWKADANKTSHCLVHFSSKLSKERSLLSIAIVIRPCWTNFCSQKLKRRILASLGFKRKALSATQPKLHSIFYALFLKIAEVMSFDYLGAAIWHHWTIVCGVLSKLSVTPTNQRQLTL